MIGQCTSGRLGIAVSAGETGVSRRTDTLTIRDVGSSAFGAGGETLEGAGPAY